MTYAKDSLGRSTGRRFNMAAMKREFEAMQKRNETFEYRGFEVSGGSGKWFVANWQSIYSSRAKALEAVDNCLNLRAMLAEAQ